MKNTNTVVGPESIQIIAMRRAHASIRRGDPKNAAYWMALADRAHRMNFRWSSAQSRSERDRCAIEDMKSRIAARDKRARYS